MRSETKSQEWFLRDPLTKKWIRQCAACHTYGRDPITPEHIPKKNFENMFPIIHINELGICSVCSGRVKQNHKE